MRHIVIYNKVSKKRVPMRLMILVASKILNFFKNNLTKEVFPIPAGPQTIMLSCLFLESLEVTLLITSLISTSNNFKKTEVTIVALEQSVSKICVGEAIFFLWFFFILHG